MRHDRHSDLVELLERARGVAAELAAPPLAVSVGERPGFLVAGPDGDPGPVIDRLVRAGRVTFVVGAGVSMEAGLPSWATLVHDVLEAVAPSALGPADRAAWIAAASETGLLGMAATARALAGSDARFIELVDEHTYRGKGAESFDPGPIAREIAAWKAVEPSIGLATFNYDQLLEVALRDCRVEAQARGDSDPGRDGVAVVRHLHGALTGTPAADAVVLTEGDYARWPAGGWQDAFMQEALEGLCVFVGLSFTDQNLLRWIYGAHGGGHVAILTRQGTPRLSRPVRAEFERGTRLRLEQAGVAAYWADFYAEVAQLIHDARRRRHSRVSRAYLERAQPRARRASRLCLPGTGLLERQQRLQEILRGLLAGVRSTVEDAGVDASKATLGLGLWALDYEERAVTLLLSSDRIHVDASTVASVPLSWDSDWVAVEAITRGVVVERDPQTYASRWRTVRGIPLVWSGEAGRDRVIVGAATLTTTAPPEQSVLTAAEREAPGTRRSIDRALQDQLVRFWD